MMMPRRTLGGYGSQAPQRPPQQQDGPPPMGKRKLDQPNANMIPDSLAMPQPGPGQLQSPDAPMNPLNSNHYTGGPEAGMDPNGGQIQQLLQKLLGR